MSKRKHKISDNPVQPRTGIDTPKKDHWIENVLFLVIITILFLGTYSYIFDKKMDLNGDNANYYMLGKALSQGDGYVNIANPDKVPNNHYPPGYPFILSIFMQLSDSVVFLKVINGFLLFTALIFLYFLILRLSDKPKIAFISIFLIVINYHFLQYGSMMMSEVSFLLVSVLTIFVLDRIDLEQKVFTKPGLYLMILLLGASYYIRSTGLALFGGILLFLILRKQWKIALVTFMGFTALILPWIIRGQNLGGSSYIRPLIMINPYRPELGQADLSGYVARLFSNLSRYITREIPSSSFSFIKVNYVNEISITEWITGIIITALIFYGMYHLRKKGLVILCYLLGSFGILLLWPEVWTGVRFILPVTPFLIFFSILGFYYFIELILKTSGVNFKFNMLLLVFMGFLYFGSIKSLHEKAKRDYPASWKNYFKIANYFKTEGIKDVMVICRKPMLFHVKSGTYTSNYRYLVNNDSLIYDLIRQKTDYVVLDNLGYRQTYEYLLPAIQNNKTKFQALFKIPDPDTYLLKFKPGN